MNDFKNLALNNILKKDLNEDYLKFLDLLKIKQEDGLKHRNEFLKTIKNFKLP